MSLPRPLAALVPPTIVLDSPLSPDQVLARLRERGREWRESRVPAAMRARGVLRMDVRVTGHRFTLSFRGDKQTAMPARLYGTVQPSATGSRLALRVMLHPVLRVLAVVWAIGVVAGALSASSAHPAERIVLAVGMVAPGLLLAALGAFADRAEHDELLRAAHDIAAVPLPAAPEHAA